MPYTVHNKVVEVKEPNNTGFKQYHYKCIKYMAENNQLFDILPDKTGVRKGLYSG